MYMSKLYMYKIKNYVCMLYMYKNKKINKIRFKLLFNFFIDIISYFLKIKAKQMEIKIN